MNWSPSSIKALPGRLPAEREIEDLAVEIESLVDIADFEGDVIDADEPRLLGIGLAGLGHPRPSCWFVPYALPIYVNRGLGFSRDCKLRFARIDGRRVLRGGGPLARRTGMDLLTKLPEMSDDALANLRTNAKRLQQSGTPAQRTDAAALLPAVEAEIGARRLAKVKATRSAPRKDASARRRGPPSGPSPRLLPTPIEAALEMPVDLTIEGAVAKVVLNRPDKLNALTVDMRQSLCDYFAQLRFDDKVRVVIVTGAGRGFCSGADVDRMAGQPHDLRADRERMQRGGHTFIRALHSIEKPMIAAVRGPAVGIGWSIALACDLVVASKTARFSQIFRRIGLAPDGGAIWFLTRRLGMAKAKELVFSARFVEADEALALGLVNHVVEDDELMSKTEELAAELAEAPTFALGLAKKLFHAAVGPSLEDYLEIESMVQPQLHMTADNAEGVAAFREKRKPKFIGR